MTVQATQNENGAKPAESVDETASFEVVTSDVPEPAEPKSTEQEAETGEEANSEGAAASQGGESSGEEATETGDNSTAEPKGRKSKKNGVQKRIDELVTDRETQRQRAEKAEAEVERLKGKDNSDKSKAEEPKESDFEKYDDYLDALGKWKKESGEESTEEAPTDNNADNGLTDNQKTAMAVLKERFDADRDNFEDFDKVALDKDLPVSKEMLEALAECDDPAKVLYHLGKNPELSKEISEKSPSQVMREITKLDLAIEAKPSKPVKTTEAPDPIDPVGNNSEGEKAVEDMSFAEYEAHMNQQERKEKGGW